MIDKTTAWTAGVLLAATAAVIGVAVVGTHDPKPPTAAGSPGAGYEPGHDATVTPTPEPSTSDPWGGVTAADIPTYDPNDPTPESALDDSAGAPQGGGDVLVGTCSVDDDLHPYVSLRITNSTLDVTSYLVTVSFNDASGDRVGSGVVAANDLTPGQSTREEVTDYGSLYPSDEPLDCAVADVSRL